MSKQKSQKFLKLIEKHKETKKPEKFSGCLEDYLGVIEADPTVTKLAHKKLFDALATKGVTKMSITETDPPINSHYEIPTLGIAKRRRESSGTTSIRSCRCRQICPSRAYQERSGRLRANVSYRRLPGTRRALTLDPSLLERRF